MIHATRAPRPTRERAPVRRAYVGIGANLGDPVATIERAIAALTALKQARLVARSSLYRSAPLGYTAQPDFFNAVAALDTSRTPQSLLAALHRIEARFGRERPFANAPRTLDLDLLIVGTLTLSAPRLTLPHPRMHERAFVLAPLVEIAPTLKVPGHGPAAALLRACADQRIERL